MVLFLFNYFSYYIICMGKSSTFNNVLNRLYFTVRELGYTYEIIDIDKTICYFHIYSEDKYVCYVLLDYETINFIQIGYDFSFPNDFSVFFMKNIQHIYSLVSKYGCFLEFEVSSTIDLSFCNKVYYSGFNHDSFNDCLNGLLKLMSEVKDFFNTKSINMDIFTLIEDDISLSEDEFDEDLDEEAINRHIDSFWSIKKDDDSEEEDNDEDEEDEDDSEDDSDGYF